MVLKQERTLHCQLARGGNVAECGLHFAGVLQFDTQDVQAVGEILHQNLVLQTWHDVDSVNCPRNWSVLDADLTFESHVLELDNSLVFEGLREFVL